jgi:hypothetical protein
MGVVPEQSELFTHCTQRELVVSQTVAPIIVHCVSFVQPARHINVRWSQTGAAVPQSEFARHATQVPNATLQRGEAAGQSVLALHWTHRCDVGLHILAVAGQSLAVRHPTQAPVAMSHRVPRPHGAPPSPVQAAWHVRLPG